MVKCALFCQNQENNMILSYELLQNGCKMCKWKDMGKNYHCEGHDWHFVMWFWQFNNILELSLTILITENFKCENYSYSDVMICKLEIVTLRWLSGFLAHNFIW